MNKAEDVRSMSPGDLMVLGVSDLAYVKPVEIEGQSLFAVFTADGTQVAVLPSREAAVVTILRHDLEVVSIH
jgi:hypothetical protein